MYGARSEELGDSIKTANIVSKRKANYSNTDLVGSLEEFGLSKYEARAYLTMTGKGSLAASEIAYYSNLPRTKIYQTVKKLEKKKLALISKQKPLICSAIPPDEAFAEIVKLHERRLKNMRKIVERLQRIDDERHRPHGAEERRYFILDPDSVLDKVKNLISHSNASITAQLDTWGLRLISQCKLALLKALASGVKVKLIVNIQCIENEELFSLVDDIELRIGEVTTNVVTVDSVHAMTIDSSNGKAVVFVSAEVLVSSQAKHFQQLWSRSMDARSLSSTGPNLAMKAFRLIEVVENGLSTHMLERASSSRADFPPDVLEVMEHKYGLKLGDMDEQEILHVIDSALKFSCSGGLKHDKNSNIISLESTAESKSVLPWALVLTSYFKRLGNEPKLMQNSKQGAQVVHLKLTRPIR